MKKLFLCLLIVPVLFACNPNNPSSSKDKDFLPKLCDQVFMANVDDAVSILKKKGIDTTPFDASADSIMLSGEWGELIIKCSKTGDQLINFVSASYPSVANKDIFSIFKSWEAYADKMNPNPYLWYAYLEETAKDYSMYEDGQMIAYVKTSLEMLYNSGQLTQEEYNAYLLELGHGHEEFDTKMKEISEVLSVVCDYIMLDTDKSILELAMNPDALQDLTGKGVGIYYENSDNGNAPLLEYVLYYLDASEVIDMDTEVISESVQVKMPRLKKVL